MTETKGKEGPKGFSEESQKIPLSGNKLKKGRMSYALEAALEEVENMGKDKKH